MAGRDRINWWIPLYAVISAIAVMLLLFAYDSAPALSFILLIVPIVGLAFITLLLLIALRKQQRQSLSMLLALAAFLVTSGALLKTQDVLRPSLRWLLWSHRLKAQVLAQSTRSDGELKHIEWDGWGGTPVGDWTAYVVYDPTDSLSAPTQSSVPADYKGIPCKVISVRRLEKQWYSVVLDMNQFWDKMHPDC